MDTGAAAMTWIRTRAATSVGIGIADQALSSLLGLALAVAVARSVPASSFGAFALALATYYIALGASRALSSEPLVVRFSGIPQSEFRREAPRAAGSALAVALVAMAIAEAFAVATTGPLRTSLMTIGFVLPALLVQDFMRVAAFSQGRGSVALASDAVWAIAAILGLATVAATSTDSPGLFILAWGGSAVLGALVAMERLGVRPHLGQAFAFLRSQKDIAPRFLGEFAAASGAGQLAIFLVGAAAGLSTAGALRASLVLLGPLNMLIMGVNLVAVPHAVGLAREHLSPRLLRFSTLLSVSLTLLAIGYGLTIATLPADVGELLLGASWADGSSIAVLMAFYAASTGAMSGAFAGLRALAAASSSLRVRLLLLPLILVGVPIGAYFDGASGAAAAFAATGWLGVALWWRAYVRTLNEVSAAVGSTDIGATNIATHNGQPPAAIEKSAR